MALVPIRQELTTTTTPPKPIGPRTFFMQQCVGIACNKEVTTVEITYYDSNTLRVMELVMIVVVLMLNALLIAAVVLARKRCRVSVESPFSKNFYDLKT
ncbi:unnamed protein product [Strongylus vulgaris]|uniref:Uncharacterized protein n=1 Tax=Strongylus vulgaris TaxID=40348 RepID=A0A3P7IU33_STRVU|nr:unnamed protein product [Strongylus vulgaris]